MWILITGIITVLQSVSQLCQDIQEFIFNGATIVLPEIVHLFKCSDPSVLTIYKELE